MGEPQNVLGVIYRFLELLLRWPVVVLSIGLLFICLFRKEIRKLIDRIHKFSGKFGNTTLDVELSQLGSKAPAPGDKILTEAEVLSALSEMKEFDEDELKRQLPFIYVRLREQGINTSGQLSAMLTNDRVMAALRNLYIEKLDRPKERPLDPIGLATYAPPLYFSGPSTTMVETISSILTSSEEHAQNNLWVRMSPGIRKTTDK